ncbi:stage III sporulation protein AE [Alteribacillus iranensis]|uniref:Stage III sporulation protein AE n=1 Tax=Alteribacillus iranensis TaxID=930128 RepID=A0A1I1ZKV1_9BACI|nr:stage III sporulation protein AE [Alteribacillus iranensis]SFE30970.1 stage III sporulation protein AE [Alteribacillus iranensis]
MYEKKWLLLLLVLSAACVFFIHHGSIQAEETSDTEGMSVESLKEEQLKQLDIESITAYWENVVREYGTFLPESQKGSLTDFIKGEKKFAPGEWGKALLRYLLHEVIANGQLMGTLLLLTVFSAILKAIQNAFEKEAVGKVAYAVIFIILIVIALNSFYVAMDYVREAVSLMSHFIIALLPLLLGLLAASGSIASAGIFHPLVIMLVQVSGIFVQNIVLPLLFFSAVLSIASQLNEHIRVTKLAELLRHVAMGSLAAFLTVFLGIISVQGTAAAVADGLTIRTAKFLAGNFIPVIGRMFTDAADTALGASILLKNTVGIAGVGILVIICAFPALKVLAIGFIFQATAAVVQPLAEEELIDALSTLGRNVFSMFAALAAVSFMFFLALTIIIVSGNLSLMVR